MTQRVALVTGASRGIGRRIAEVLLEKGHKVAGTARSEASFKDFSHPNLLPIGADASDPASAKSAVEKTVAWGGGLHILVNNAGIHRDNLVMRMTDEEWDDVVSTNLTAVFRMIRAAARPLLKAKWGRIINISSIVGIMGNAGQPNYSAAKAGVIGLTKSVAKELATRAITVNCICPGFIETDMTKDFTPEMREKILPQIPLGRFGATSDIAHLAAFLASEEAGYITGQVLVCDGGMVI